MSQMTNQPITSKSAYWGFGLIAALALASAAFLAATPAHARQQATSESRGFQDCAQHFGDAFPSLPTTAPDKQRELCFDEFAIMHSGDTKTPLFVAQRLNRQLLVDAKAVDRRDNFYEEARLPSSHRAWLRDYRATDSQGRRYDRGHLAPAADMATGNGMAQSFSLANMVPQVPANNRGPWAKIEEDTRRYVMRARGDVYVVTGAVFSAQPQRLGQGNVAIPSSLYKLVYDKTTGKSWAHWLDNTESARSGKPLSLEELEQRTGIRFFANKLSTAAKEH